MKVAIIGIGSVGSAVATAVKNTGLFNEIVLFDRDGARARAAAEDLGHASAFERDIKITDVSNYRGIRGSDIVVIAAGANQKPGQPRSELVKTNASVISDVIPKVMQNVDKNKIKIVIVTNPLDAMVILAQKLSGLPSERVIGTGTMLDSARLRTILSRHLCVSPQSINAYVLGEHGDSSVINWSSITIGSVALNDFCRQVKMPISASAKKTIEHRVHAAAYEIIQGRGATWDGIAAAVADLLRTIINNENRIVTVSCVSKNVALSLPRIVGECGCVATLMPQMSKAESEQLQTSISAIRANYKLIK
ncbi:MAG: NAD(P)-binding domain-containing protein [Proteobacteria bacterium]|nr:NAD(P)-binding domain-containing protein [Candidatus Enterousia scatequi]